MAATFPKDSRMQGGVGAGHREPQRSLFTPTQPPVGLLIKLQIMFTISQCLPARVRVTDGPITAQTPISPVLELL